MAKKTFWTGLPPDTRATREDFRHDRDLLSVEYAENALILFDVAAIFAVITRNADSAHH